MEDREKIVRLNIEYYKKLFEKDPDETRRQMLMRYLDEEQVEQNAKSFNSSTTRSARRAIPEGSIKRP